MKALLKNWLLPIKSNCFLYKNKAGFILALFFLLNNISKGQIANYVNNGGFEICSYCASTPSVVNAQYWYPLDTTKYMAIFLSEVEYPYLVPASSFGYQQPKGGHEFMETTFFFKPNTPQTGRGYPRNILKQTLQAGATYCVKIYYNISNQSTHGIDGLGAYFGDNSLDTIHQSDKPITYLTPQIQNPNNNILIDTLNWSLLTGTFTANGTEKYMLLGNFKSDVATNSVLINPTNLPTIGTDVLFDDISVIDINLPAYASPDIWGIPTTTVYLGRPQDVGIDEACMWYHLPNNTTAIDTAAGITITVAATTQTYMVKQDICGNIKYDTVVVYSSATGISGSGGVQNSVKIYPNPVQDLLQIQITGNNENQFTKIEILNSLGQIVREEDLNFKNNIAEIKTSELPNGIYHLNVTSTGSATGMSKRFVIAR